MNQPATYHRLAAPDVYVDDTRTPKGRGVFAGRDFKGGDIVDEAPVIVLPIPFLALPDPLKTVVFNWGILTHTSESSAIVLGFGSMYNHDNPANLRYEADAAKRTMKFIATRPIQAGEELTINYNAIGGGAQWHDDNWFDRMRVPLEPKE